MGAALGAINSALPACFPKMLYNSELDPAWRTGCRDSGVAAAVGTLACSNGFTSSLSFMGGEICIGPKWGPSTHVKWRAFKTMHRSLQV